VPHRQGENRSVVIVSHDQRIKDIADRTLWLEDGGFGDVVEMDIHSYASFEIALLDDWETFLRQIPKRYGLPACDRRQDLIS
jgi:hypothetical protein